MWLWMRTMPAAGLLFVVCYVGACRPSSKHSKNIEGVLPQRSVDALYAVDYFLADGACRSGVAEVSEAQVRFWDGKQVVRTLDAALDWTSRPSLSGPGVFATSYNLHQRQKCQKVGENQLCKSKAEVVTEPTKLVICRDQGDYPRHSFEGVALTSLAHLQKAQRFYDSLDGRKVLNPASLLVLPKIEIQVAKHTGRGHDQVSRSVLTDNLAYVPSYINGPAFVIFPKGRFSQSQGLWENLNLWEIPWALAHEFGHHVFRSHSGLSRMESASARGLDWKGRAIRSWSPEEIPQVEDHTSTRYGGNLAPRDGNAASIWSAVNEGFADLYAHYVQDKTSGLLDGIGCFGQNRDVSKAMFLDGREKALSEEVLGFFLNGDPRTRASNCDQPDYADVHIIGAVIAHGMAQLLEESIREASPGDQSAIAGSRLLQWAEALGDYVQQGMDPSLEGMIRTALPVVSVNGQLTSNQCDSLRKVFPIYAPQWIGNEVQCLEG